MAHKTVLSPAHGSIAPGISLHTAEEVMFKGALPNMYLSTQIFLTRIDVKH